MKHLLLILVVFLAVSCYMDVPSTVTDSSKQTTLEMIQHPKDTVLCYAEGHTLYVFDHENKLKYKVDSIQQEALPVHALVFVIMLVTGIFGVVGFITKAFE